MWVKVVVVIISQYSDRRSVGTPGTSRDPFEGPGSADGIIRLSLYSSRQFARSSTSYPPTVSDGAARIGPSLVCCDSHGRWDVRAQISCKCKLIEDDKGDRATKCTRQTNHSHPPAETNGVFLLW